MKSEIGRSLWIPPACPENIAIASALSLPLTDQTSVWIGIRIVGTKSVMNEISRVTFEEGQSSQLHRDAARRTPLRTAANQKRNRAATTSYSYLVAILLMER